ncbi:MAG: BadF/BadG/BcrA/BcrD ATPase family protein [Planctomycetota bacterium]
MIALGIDAGGTKAAWCARTDAGAELRGQAGAIQAAAADAGTVAGAIAAIVAEVEAGAHQRVGSLVAGLAGAGNLVVRRSLREALTQELGASVRIAVIGDVEVAAAACLAEAPGVAVWSGTGSFAVARAADGKLHRAGGRGLLLDDRGGAAAIVIAAARRAVEAADGIGEPLPWSSRLVDELGAASAIDLGRTMRGMSPGDLARRVFVVEEAARQGEPHARAILVDELDALAARTRAAVTRAGLTPPSCRVWVGGGVFMHSTVVRELFGAALESRGFTGQLTVAPAAVGGALTLALALAERRLPLSDWLEDDHAA